MVQGGQITFRKSDNDVVTRSVRLMGQPVPVANSGANAVHKGENFLSLIFRPHVMVGYRGLTVKNERKLRGGLAFGGERRGGLTSAAIFVRKLYQVETTRVRCFSNE